MWGVFERNLVSREAALRLLCVCLSEEDAEEIGDCLGGRNTPFREYEWRELNESARLDWVASGVFEEGDQC